MSRILTTFLALSSTILAFGAAAMEPRSSDRQTERAETVTAESEFRPGPYVYQHATDLDSCFWLYSIKNPGQTLTCRGGWSASATTELKRPDADDPSLVWYMSEGPIRFYLPTGDASKLSNANWRHRDCQYKIVSVSSGDVLEERLPDLIPSAGAYKMLIESHCDEPEMIVQYLFDFRFGLLSFTVGEITSTEAGENVFSPKETYHLIGYASGFGQPAGK